MPAYPRYRIVDPEKIEIFHIFSRCVQRAWLCGFDPISQRDFNYRREWIKKLIEYQAGVFAVDVGNYNILSNHLHLIVRTRPDIVKTWSDEEVAWRWKRAWPRWDPKNGIWDCLPSDQSIQVLLADSTKIAQIRKGLSSLSWFAARVKEPIARLANAETERRGHFWEQRFFSRKLSTEGAVLMCSIYVDLNQVKAGLASDLEHSDYSAIQERLRLWKQTEAEASLQAFLDQEERPDVQITLAHMEELYHGLWLSPISERNPLLVMPPEFYSTYHKTRVAVEGTANCETTTLPKNVVDAAQTVLAESSTTHLSTAPPADVGHDTLRGTQAQEPMRLDTEGENVSRACDGPSIPPVADAATQASSDTSPEHGKAPPSASDGNSPSVGLSQPCRSGHDSPTSRARRAKPPENRGGVMDQGECNANRPGGGDCSNPGPSALLAVPPKADDLRDVVNPGEDNATVVSCAVYCSEEPTIAKDTVTKRSTGPNRDGDLTYLIDSRLRPHARRRASDDAFLPLRIDAYLALVGWSLLAYRASQAAAQHDAPTAESRLQAAAGANNVAGSQTTPNSSGKIANAATSAQLEMPKTLQQVLVRFDISPDRWAFAVKQFERIFGRAVGNANALDGILILLAQRWLRGITACREIFLTPRAGDRNDGHTVDSNANRNTPAGDTS